MADKTVEQMLMKSMEINPIAGDLLENHWILIIRIKNMKGINLFYDTLWKVRGRWALKCGTGNHCSDTMNASDTEKFEVHQLVSYLSSD